MAAASVPASLKQRGWVWTECSSSRRSLTSQDAVKSLLWKCRSQGFSLHLRAVSRRVILGAAILPIPLGLGWDLPGTYLWDCEKVASLVLQQTDLQRLMSDAVPGGTISSDPKEWCQKLWCLSLKLNALCSISNVQWGNSFLLSLSQSLLLPVLFLIASKTWQGSACSCFPKWMGSQLLACAFLSSGIGCSNTLFIDLWDYPISYKIQQKQQQLCVCVCLCFHSFPALADQHQL